MKISQILLRQHNLYPVPKLSKRRQMQEYKVQEQCIITGMKTELSLWALEGNKEGHKWFLAC